MEALRKMIDGADLFKVMDVPESFRKKKLEVIIIPLDEESHTRIELKKPGVFKDYLREGLMATEKDAWEIAMREKHENS
jgi:hypothetical protein